MVNCEFGAGQRPVLFNFAEGSVGPGVVDLEGVEAVGEDEMEKGVSWIELQM